METTRRGRGAAGACTRGDNYGSASLMRDPPSSFPVGRPHARTYIRQEPLRERIEHGSSLQTMTRGVGEGRDRTPGKPMTRCKSSVGFRIATISRTLPTCTPRDKRTSLELRMMHRLPCTITKMMHWIRRVIRGREEEGIWFIADAVWIARREICRALDLDKVSFDLLIEATWTIREEKCGGKKWSEERVWEKASGHLTEITQHPVISPAWWILVFKFTR